MLLALLASLLAVARVGAAVFSRDVQPVLAKSCVSCHGPEKQKGGLRLDRREDALKGGDHGALWISAKANDSLLIQVVEGRHADIERMPKKNDALSTNDIAALRRWIDAGALWPEGVTIAEAARADTNWWSLQPLRAVAPPSPEGLPKGWDGPIDRFIFAALAAKGLAPSPPAERRALIRRVTYDVTGLPPTPEEVEAFVNESHPSHESYEKLVDRLLAHPAYGERWGRFWLDVVRFGESNGYERNHLWPNAWPFRDYVIRSLNDDKPFDRFIVEHLAGDALAPGEPDAETGNVFLVAGPYDDVGNQDPVAAAQIRANHLDDMVRASSEAFLGMTVGCARCHHHKFDPIPTEDYYRMQSVFAGVWPGNRTLATAAERAAREQALKPLQAERERLAKERGAVEEQILQRAASTAASTNNLLPAPDPYLTEDRFAPVEARAVRLAILSNDRDVRNPGGARLDEFEVWTDEPAPRNVALATTGARADGGIGRVAEDAAGAYDAGFVIDGKFDVKWLAPPRGVLTVTFARPERIGRVAFSSDRQRNLARDNAYENIFVGEYRLEVSADGTNWTTVADGSNRAPINAAFARARTLRTASTEGERAQFAELDRQLAAVDAKIRAVPALRQVWAGNFRAATNDTFVMIAGDPQRRGADLAPASLDFLPAAARFQLATNAPESERRLAFARWLVSPENPLTPRVLANRVWQSHFGVGLVDTPSDFGWLGGRPSHPELLDWLARRLVAHGWRLKPLHREILLSAVYQQRSADFSPLPRDMATVKRTEVRAPKDIDAHNRLLWCFPPRRLSAEEIRDSMLAVAGKLDPRAGGPGFRLYRYLEDNVATFLPLDVHGPETYRRAVYHQSPRSARVDLLGDFDCPDNAIAAPSRVMTTSPLQALTLLNHRFTFDMAEALAARVRKESVGDDAAAVRRLFALTFSRTPTEPETAAALKLARTHGWPALCRAQLNANEFLYVD